MKLLNKVKAKIKNIRKNEKKARQIVFFVPLIIISLWLFWGIPLPTKLSSEKIPVSTKLFDRSGKLIYEIYSDQRRSPVELNELPQYVIDATISIEDKDFYKHYGFSLTGMLRAAYKIAFKGKLEGGSTLTQQLVKNSLLNPERTIRRKIREFVLSMVVESIYSKDQILEMYLNQIPYGSTAYGIESASELYFNKAAKDLSLAEATLLAGLPQAPTRFSPFGAHPEYAKERQSTVLRRMVEDNKISKEEADEAKEKELDYAKITPIKAPHFALWVKEQLVEKYGEKIVEQGGLRVTTTLDLDLQEFAQDAVATEVAKLKNQNVGNGALIATRPKTGEIIAMVGSKDYFAEDEDGKVNVTLAKRQPGSSIKPINYALALKDGKITAATALADVPTCFIVAGQPLYCPVNYDGSFHGLTQVRFALGNSYNIPAVRVLALNSVENLVYFAKSMGLSTLEDPKNYGLSLTLGGGEVRQYDMAIAFGVFANQGIKQPLISILKVEDWKGKIYQEIKTNEIELSGERVLSPEVSFLVSHILHDNNARSQAFGTNSFLVVRGHPEVSVKTGTTNDRRDNWTVGFTPLATIVTWVGNNDNSP
ncbi:penicillin-binding protein, partial [Patescibacteria group bacterium]|nr:penicillin-binding protein [Patescibacteria group bacterium]